MYQTQRERERDDDEIKLPRYYTIRNKKKVAIKLEPR